MRGLPHSRNHRSSRIAGIFVLVLLSACTFLSEPGSITRSVQPWAGALRALDPADTGIPSHDLTAVYMRRTGEVLQVRIDLLDFRSPGELSLDVRFSDESATQASLLNIHIPPEDESTRVFIDPQLATVIVEIPASDIPPHPLVDVSTPEDHIAGLTLDAPSPTQAVHVLLTFYNVFTGRIPAEALRSWDGAHSGPRGERHGLKHVLDAVEEHQVPIVLLDLKDPASLSALDAMGVLPRIKQMHEDGMLILPDQHDEKNLFDLSPSQFLWAGVSLQGILESRPTFVLSSDPAHIYRPFFGGTRFLPVAAGAESTQPTSDGLPLEIRRSLLEFALNADENDILVLGGDLSSTTWGSPDMLGPALAYLASRPYIRNLSADELLDFPAKTGKPEVLPTVLGVPNFNIESHYENLTRPVLDYSKKWDGSPLSNCDIDIDDDGQAECILANESSLAVLDPRGARLTYLFAREGDGLHQLIGPSWQVAVGLSNPSTWDFSAGEAADPGAYLGAFTDEDDPFKLYDAALNGNTLIFSSLDGSRTKTFKLTGTGLEVEYHTRQPAITQISLLVDPNSRFTPGWAEKYIQQNTPGGIAWGLEDGSMVRIQTEGSLMMRAFNESLSLLATPEDPDLDYPPGHFVPFPMAIAEIKMDGRSAATIQIITSYGWSVFPGCRTSSHADRGACQ